MNGWKVFGIIMLIVNIVLFGSLYYFYTLGVDMVNSENHCNVNICNSYESYFYDSVERMCYCYNGGEMQKESYVQK